MKYIFDIHDDVHHTYIGLFEVIEDSVVFVAELLAKWFETINYRVWMNECQRCDFVDVVRERFIILILVL